MAWELFKCYFVFKIMGNYKSIFCNELYIRWIGITVIGCLFPAFLDITDSFVVKYSYVAKVGFSLFYTAICWNSAVWITCYFRGIYQGYAQTRWRIKYSIPSIILMIFAVNLGLAYLIDVYIMDCPFILAERWRVPVLATICSLAIFAGYEGAYVYEQLQASMLEAQKFQTEHIKSQFEVLKTQIDPHFLFNSLNTLASIITENPSIAVHFAEKLSQVYRYILQNKDKEVVSLSTEINFVKSYIFLLQTRFEQNLVVHFEVEDAQLDAHIPPLSLQILVENAIKHNVVSNDKPLHIWIYIDEATRIVVRNTLQLKRSVKDSTKIGLDNVIKRYQYLTERAVEILPTAQDFQVSLPLLRVA